jgi:hypothetical protein
MELWIEDPHFYVKQGLGTGHVSSLNFSSNASVAVGGRRLGGGIAYEEDIPLENDCVMAVGFGWSSSDGACFEVERDSKCGEDPPGWYTKGGISGCVSADKTSLTGTACLGYTWGVEVSKTIKVAVWSKKIKFGCELTVYGCASVTTEEINVATGGSRRRRRQDLKYGATFGASVNVGGECDFGAKVSIEGDLSLAVGPCGAGLDQTAKLAISSKGCFKIGPFKGCVSFPVHSFCWSLWR